MIYLLTLFIFLSAALVIINKNPIHSILFLTLVFIGSSIILVMQGVDFIAMLFLVVYIGAIAVLFLFVVMMLNIRVIDLSSRFIYYVPIGILLILVLLFLFITTLASDITFNTLSEVFGTLFIIFISLSKIWINFNNLSLSSYISWADLITTDPNIEMIASVLYTTYCNQFILAGMILLVAMIGAIVLTLNQRLENKKQIIYYQTNRDVKAAVRYFK